MLTKERNDELTQVGPGKPMGEVLRHYWYPVAMVRELEESDRKRVRLLGEDFVVYRTPAGEYGIIAERCPHRGASLAYGVVTEGGIRCSYHGWSFDLGGRCTRMPNYPEDSPFRKSVCARVGKAQPLGGLIWAYIGADPAPELPRYEAYVLDGVRDIGHTVLPCNWLQIMENSVDPYHVESLHGEYFAYLGQRDGFEAPSVFTSRKHVRIGFTPFEHGIIKRRILTGQTEESDDWKIGHPLVFPYCMWVGGNGVYQMQIRVPRDDTSTWVAFYSVHAPDGLDMAGEETVVDYPILWQDENGDHITDYIEGQDIMAWVSQGPIADRTSENIGEGDQGVIKLRKMCRDAIKAVQEGRDPVAVVREPHGRIELPLERSKFGAGAEFALQWLKRGSMRYSPQNERLRQLHLDGAARRGERIAS
ncbi:MAG: Rieske 2Fe-2S domain-containing protein [Sandaracinaceae bacterium]